MVWLDLTPPSHPLAPRSLSLSLRSVAREWVLHDIVAKVRQVICPSLSMFLRGLQVLLRRRQSGLGLTHALLCHRADPGQIERVGLGQLTLDVVDPPRYGLSST